MQEKIVADFFSFQYIVLGIIVRRKHLREIVSDLWKTFDPESRVRIAHNFFSYKFVNNFCKRNRFSFRRMRKKRLSINIEEVAEYSREYSEVLAALPWSRVLNMDETPFNFVFLRGEV